MKSIPFTDADFNFLPFEGDNDRSTMKADFFGSMTKNVRKSLESYVRNFNRRWAYPYGVGHRCGCSHDCCGCLVSKRMSIQFKSDSASIFYTEIFNY